MSAETTTKTFREIIGKPSAAAQAMVDGLRRHSQRPDFRISMTTFGFSCGEVCFGCAATCATQEAAQVNYDTISINYTGARAVVCGVSESDLWKFEGAINSFRTGFTFSLLAYFGLSHMYREGFNERFKLQSSDWKNQLEAVEILIAEWRELGI